MDNKKPNTTNDATKAIIVLLVIVCITGGILFSIAKLVYTLIIDVTIIDNTSEELTTYMLEKEEYNNLNIELGSIELEIKTGEKFEISTNYLDIEINEINDTLEITSETKSSLSFSNDAKLILIIPSNYEFNNISIKLGASSFKAKELIGDNVSLELGAGRVTINDLKAKESTKINGGAGMFTIESGSIHNLKLNMGVGEASISAYLAGKSEILAGVGNIDLNLLGINDDYKIDVSKGMGTIFVNDKEIENDKIIGSGKNKITVSGGIGTIDIKIANY